MTDSSEDTSSLNGIRFGRLRLLSCSMPASVKQPARTLYDSFFAESIVAVALPMPVSQPVTRMTALEGGAGEGCRVARQSAQRRAVAPIAGPAYLTRSLGSESIVIS